MFNRLVGTIQDVFGMVLLAQIFVISLSFGINIYYLSLYGTEIPNFSFFVFCMMAIFFMVFFNNWFGNEVIISVRLS